MYTQFNIHIVFAVRGREHLMTKDIRGRIFEYISGIIRGLGLFPLAVNGYIDHVHIFFELPPDQNVSKIVQQVKINSSKWINEQRFFNKKFHWQNGYGGFSYSRSQRTRVINYITNQEDHHKQKTFRKEYLDFLKRFEIKFDEKYLFEFYD